MTFTKDPKQPGLGAASTSASDNADERPPTYVDSSNEESLPSNSSSTPPIFSSHPESALKMPNIKPSNFIFLSHSKGSIKGTYLIDPYLIIPAPFLPPLAEGETEETRKHLFLDSRGGSVVGDIIIVPGLGGGIISSDSVKKTKAVRIRAQSSNGSITINVRDQPTPSVRRPFLNLSAYSPCGNLHIRVPRSFSGPLNIKTTGSVNLSDGIKANVRLLSQTGGEMRAFLGDWEESGRVGDRFVPPIGDDKRTTRLNGVDGMTWTGDVLDAETKNGSVNIYYADEENLRRGPGFWSKLFGNGSVSSEDDLELK